MRRAIAAFLGLLALFAVAGACTTPEPSGPMPCNVDPFQCATSETCWPDSSSTKFACIAAGSGTKGDTCQLVAGSPTCAPGLICLMEGSSGGVCTTYCDPTGKTHDCPSSETCLLLMLGQGGLPLHACVPSQSATAGTGQ